MSAHVGRTPSISRVLFHVDTTSDEEHAALTVVDGTTIASEEVAAAAAQTTAASEASKLATETDAPMPRKRLTSAGSSAYASDFDEGELEHILVTEDTAATALTRTPFLSPMPSANLLSRLTWYWVQPTIRIGASRTMNEDDLHDLLEFDEAGYQLRRIEQAYEKTTAHEHARHAGAAGRGVASTPSQARVRVSLWRTLWHGYGWHYLRIQSLLLLYTGFKVLQPLMLNQLVKFVSNEDEPAWHGWLYAVAMGFGALGQAMCHHQYFFDTFRLGNDLRVALNGLIFKKALTLKATHMMRTTTGQVINLVSNDSAKMEDLALFLPYLWNCPVECALVLGLLYQQVGVAAFAGFAAIILLTPLQLWFSKLFGKYRSYTVARTDARVKTINEILTGADVMKMMNWESSLEEKVNQIRAEEFHSISNSGYLKSYNQAASFASISVVSLITFFTLHFRNEAFTPANVFTTISLFNMLKLPLFTFLPFAVERHSEGDVALKRIRTFLELDDDAANDQAKFAAQHAAVAKHNATIAERVKNNPNAHPPGSIIMEQAAFVWELTEAMDPKTVEGVPSSPVAPPSASGVVVAIEMETPRSASNIVPAPVANDSRQGLRELNLNIGRGQLVGIIGSIGSYKSSFLAACLGEMTQLSGGALVHGTVSYASQTAWIFAGTIRENILFGRPFDAKRYIRTIRACQLVDDLKMQPAGDQTQIGEKGVNLSGGQRARLSCARAVYSDADVYLFDDPLAALDAVVARKLYQEVMSPSGMLAGKTRILVTHQTHLLTQAHIVLLEHGRIKSQGSFDQLIAEGHLTEEQKHGHHDNDSSMEEVEKLKRKKAAKARRAKKKEEDAQRQQNGGDDSTKPKTDANGIVRAETSASGKLSWHVFASMYRAGGGLIWACVVTFLMFIGQAVSIAADKWLAQWSSQDPVKQTSSDRDAYIYLGLVLATVVFGIIRAKAFFVFILRAAARLHTRMLHAVIFASMRFFESNPVGRVLNRFTKDQAITDEMLPITKFDFASCFTMTIGCLVVIGMSAPYVLLILLPIIPLFGYIRQQYLATSRELKRLEAVTRSPVYAHFSSTISGLTTIRSFKSEETFIQAFLDKMNANMRCFVLFHVSGKWFGFRLDALAASVVLCLGLVVVGTRGQISAANAGFALSYGLQLTSLFQWAVRQSTEIETMMTSVERIVEYGELPAEGALVNAEYRPPTGWPATGRIEFRDYKMRYRAGLDLVLKGVDLVVEPGEKVGVCGRTGAGKSSLFQSLLRLVEADSGAIFIDDLEIGRLGLSDLRSNLAIIPQYPVIFSGSLRYNLDPFHRCTDLQLWSALEAVQLKSMVAGLKDGLSTVMAEFGSNFSVGECQLICVARALLKPSKILLVDEATANVDQKTDELIQQVIREKFRDRTVLTIAHRLNTILDSQKIVVMAAGRVAEVGSPAELLARPPADLASDPNATFGLFSFMAAQRKAAH